MKKSIEQFNRDLNFEFLSLDIKGANIERFYSAKYEIFRFNNSGLTPTEKIEVLFSGQLNGKSEITIQNDLSERNFIQDELVRSEGYLKKPIRPIIREKLNIWLDYLNTKKILNKSETKNAYKELKTFEELFEDKENAEKVKKIFEFKGYTINGKWKGLTENRSELLCAYYVLRPLLKTGLKNTPTAKIFYSEFGLSKGYISDRMLRNEPFGNEIRSEFEDIFYDLFESLK